MHQKHEHPESCGCGCHEQAHHHHDGCGCHDHNHAHHHHEGCGCAEWSGSIAGLTDDEAAMLRLISKYGYLPVAQYLLTSSSEDSLRMVALAPVALESPDEPVEQVKARGEVLASLAGKGLITLDYHIPIQGYDYEGYTNSAIFAQLEQAASVAKTKPGFLFDRASIEGGSMALTEMGEMILN